MKLWWVSIVVAVFLVLMGLLFIAAGIDTMNDEPTKDDPSTTQDESDDPESTGICMIIICGPTFLIPAAILVAASIKARNDGSALEEVSDLMHAHDSLTVDQAAKTMGVSKSQARKLMSKCIKKGKAKGRMKNERYYSPRYLKVSESNLRRREYLIDMTDILKAYRRVAISDFAAKVGLDHDEAERVILECLEDGLLKGYISHRSKVFFSRDYLEQLDDVQIGWQCESCGAHNQEIILPGEVDRCPYCGSMSKARGTPKKRMVAEEVVDFEVLEL